MDALRVWNSLGSDCKDGYPFEWGIAILHDVCASAGEHTRRLAGALALSVLERCGPRCGPEPQRDAPKIDDAGFQCAIECVLGAEDGAPQFVAAALLHRFSDLETGGEDPVLRGVLVAILDMVGPDPEWWRGFWSVLPSREPFPLRHAIFRTIATELGWQGLYLVLEAVTPIENLKAGGSGVKALALAARTLKQILPVRDMSSDMIVPREPNMRLLMLKAMPHKAKWPFSREPLLGCDECRRQIIGYLGATGPDSSAAHALWQRDLLINQLVLQGPTVVLAELKGIVQAADDVARLRISAGLMRLDDLEQFAEVPGASDAAKALSWTLHETLVGLSDGEFSALVRFMHREGFLSIGTTKDRLLGMVPPEKIDALTGSARRALGLQ